MVYADYIKTFEDEMPKKLICDDKEIPPAYIEDLERFWNYFTDIGYK